ncbi:AI-2E family transporter [Roseimaritima ulvae]|uniref:Pheromone autoinducer 2 transporter n=1 Tax=Roseimaritima ulvae TaxID=980254 RepID=A0A5B9QMQ6_9BACT|nr:AI-2E family transporter [Roseimaritima ulvae]QEG38765.1 pheromone autoinducer 2 transporter [Roseimaritima ulvae]
MTESTTSRLPIDLLRPIAVVSLIVAIALAFTWATEIILILFLGVVFGVFLTKVAALISGKLPLGYRGSLTLTVLMLLLLMAGGLALFFVQINQQIERAEKKIDQGLEDLGRFVEQYPVVRSTVASTPFVSDALGVQKSPDKQTAENGSEDSQRAKGSQGMQIPDIPQPVQSAASSIGQLFKTTFGLIVNSLLIFFVGLFLAISPTTYRDGLVQLVPPPRRARAKQVLNAVGDTLWRWLIGRFGSMLVTGLGAFLLLLALGVPMAGTLGIVTALLTFIPNIGAAIALSLAMLFALPEGTATVGGVLAGYLALQLVESYIVTPLIQQQAVSLPPAMLIAAQAIMGVLFGFIGAAVASPLLAAGKRIVQMLYVEDYLGDSSAA